MNKVNVVNVRIRIAIEWLSFFFFFLTKISIRNGKSSVKENRYTETQMENISENLEICLNCASLELCFLLH